MRAPYTCLYREIWNDDKFTSMTEIGKLVFLYVLSSPLGNGLGCFKAGKAAMAEDMESFPERFEEGFEEGLRKGLFEYNSQRRVLLITKYFDRNPPINPNGIKALAKDYLTVPECDLKFKCYHIVREFCESRKESFVETFLESFQEPLSESLPEQPGSISPSPSPSPSVSPSGTISDSTQRGREPRASAPVYSNNQNDGEQREDVEQSSPPSFSLAFPGMEPTKDPKKMGMPNLDEYDPESKEYLFLLEVKIQFGERVNECTTRTLQRLAQELCGERYNLIDAHDIAIEAKSWEDDHPEKKKTGRGIPAFLRRWCKTEQFKKEKEEAEKEAAREGRASEKEKPKPKGPSRHPDLPYLDELPEMQEIERDRQMLRKRAREEEARKQAEAEASSGGKEVADA